MLLQKGPTFHNEEVQTLVPSPSVRPPLTLLLTPPPRQSSSPHLSTPVSPPVLPSPRPRAAPAAAVSPPAL